MVVVVLDGRLGVTFGLGDFCVRVDGEEVGAVVVRRGGVGVLMELLLVLFVLFVVVLVDADGPDFEGDVKESDGMVWCELGFPAVLVLVLAAGERCGESRSRYSAGMMVVDGDDLSGATTACALLELGGMIMLTGLPDPVLDPR